MKKLMLKSNLPLISVVMPTYNSAKYLTVAINSILDQSFKNFEFIIIDDGSFDKTKKILKEFKKIDKRIKLIKNKTNLGIVKSLNKGIEKAKGKFVARMDSDDWSYPERLKKQFNFMKRHPDVVICGGKINICDENLNIKNTRDYPTSDKKIRENIFKLNPFAHPAVMYLKAAFIKAGGYNEKLFTVEDYDLYFRLGNFGKLGNLSGNLLKLRTHKNSISNKFINKQARLNLYVRLKAVNEYGYKMSFYDNIYFVLNVFGIIFIPGYLKFKAYNLLRKYF